MDKRTLRKWTPEEDIFLAESVLSYIGENKSQTLAFEEVSLVLEDRTADACAYRWNHTLRKRYEEALERAKGKRTQVRYAKKQEKPNPTEVIVGMGKGEDEPEMTEVKSAKQIYDGLFAHMDEVLNMHQAKDDIIEGLRTENDALRAENEQLRKENDRLISLQKEMQEIAKAFEVARRLMTGGEVAISGQVFEMETNGNLNRIK